MKRSLTLLLIVSVATLALVLPAVDGQAGEAKLALESALVGQWKVPKNRYKEKISFDLTQARTFECVHEISDSEAVTWSGNWKVRTTSSGTAKAYLKARNQANPEKYMKAIVTADPALENFNVKITFNFKSDSSNWSSKLIRASGDDDEDAEDEEFGDDGEDEDLEEDEDEDFEDEEDEGDEDEDEDLEEDDEEEEDE